MTTSVRKALGMDLLLAWHGLFAGAYVVAYLTAEGSDAMHQFAGYTALGLLAARLLAAALANRPPWALPWPSRGQWSGFLRKLGRRDLSVFRSRTPLAPLSGLVLLGVMALTVLTGLMADWWDLEDLHEGPAEASLSIVLIHVAIVALGPALKAAGPAPSGAPKRAAAR